LAITRKAITQIIWLRRWWDLARETAALARALKVVHA
jgi:hypothetical protein